MIVGALRLNMHLGQARDLKAKRKVRRAILDRVQAKFNITGAEVGKLAFYHRLELGFSICSNEIGHVHHQLDKVIRYIEYLALAEVLDVQIEVLNFDDIKLVSVSNLEQ